MSGTLDYLDKSNSCVAFGRLERCLRQPEDIILLNDLLQQNIQYPDRWLQAICGFAMAKGGHLQHGAYELREALQSLVTVSDRVQNAFNEMQTCNDGADLIDPAVDALHGQMQALTEEINKVHSLRNDESDQYLKQENDGLKRGIAALEQALRREMEEHQAHLAESNKTEEQWAHRFGSLERFNNLLRTRLNDIREQYISAADQE